MEERETLQKRFNIPVPGSRPADRGLENKISTERNYSASGSMPACGHAGPQERVTERRSEQGAGCAGAAQAQRPPMGLREEVQSLLRDHTQLAS